MDNQIVTYAELNTAKNSEKQQLNPKGTKGLTSAPCYEITYVELCFQNASQDLKEYGKHCQCKGLPSSSVKFLIGILEITCLILMSTVLTLIIIFPKSKFWEGSTTRWKQNNDSSTSRTKNAYNCGFCPEEWFAYSGNCYYYSSEPKPWKESVMVCASNNSNLLSIDNKEEMDFLRSIAIVSWIGVPDESSVHPWIPIDGSISKPTIKGHTDPNNNCIALYSSGPVAESCGFSNMYFCKHSIGNRKQYFLK